MQVGSVFCRLFVYICSAIATGPAIVRMYTNAPLKALSSSPTVSFTDFQQKLSQKGEDKQPELGTARDVADSSYIAASGEKVEDLDILSSSLAISDAKMPSTTPATLERAVRHRQISNGDGGSSTTSSDAGKKIKVVNGTALSIDANGSSCSPAKVNGNKNGNGNDFKTEKARLMNGDKNSELPPLPSPAKGRKTLLSRKVETCGEKSPTKAVMNGENNQQQTHAIVSSKSNGYVMIKRRSLTDSSKSDAGGDSQSKRSDCVVSPSHALQQVNQHEVFEAIAPDGSVIHIALMPSASATSMNVNAQQSKPNDATDLPAEITSKKSSDSVISFQSPIRPGKGKSNNPSSPSLAPPATSKASGRSSKASSRGTPQPSSSSSSSSVYPQSMQQHHNYSNAMLPKGNCGSSGSAAVSTSVPGFLVTPVPAHSHAAFLQQHQQGFTAMHPQNMQYQQQRVPPQMQHVPFVAIGNGAEFLARFRPHLLAHNPVVVTTAGPHSMHNGHPLQPPYNPQQQRSSPMPPSVNGAPPHHVAQLIAAAMQQQQHQYNLNHSHNHHQQRPLPHTQQQHNNYYNSNVMPHQQQHHPGMAPHTQNQQNKTFAEQQFTPNSGANFVAGAGDTLVRPGAKSRNAPNKNIKSMPRDESFRRRSLHLTGIREQRRQQIETKNQQRRQQLAAAADTEVAETVTSSAVARDDLSLVSPVSMPAKNKITQNEAGNSTGAADTGKGTDSNACQMQMSDGAAAATMAATPKSRSPSPRPVENTATNTSERRALAGAADDSSALADLRSSAAPSPATSLLSMVSGSVNSSDPSSLSHAIPENRIGVSSSSENSSIATDDMEDIEAEAELLLRLLSEIAESPPRAEVIRCREAVIVLPTPDIEKIHPYFVVDEQDFTYEVRIAELLRAVAAAAAVSAASADADAISEKLIYAGPARSQLLIDELRPATTYRLRYCVNLDEMRSAPSEPLEFTTLPDVPSRPLLPPQLQERKKNALVLKWPTPVVATDNGSKVQRYLLEFSSTFPEAAFEQVYSGPNKSHKSVKLTPSTTYRFRLAAENDVGRSEYSDIAAYTTSGTAPVRPEPPVVFYITANEIGLSWLESAPRAAGGAHDAVDSYTVEMETLNDSTFGYMPVYAASAEHGTQCYVNGLLRCTKYRFRLRAENEEGASPWSESTECETLPQLPQAPAKPKLKGKAHAKYLRVAWATPDDTGGAPVISYFLECDTGGAEGFVSVYEGLETEATCTDLEPGVAYPVRVRCATRAGTGEYSPLAIFTTSALPPDACAFLKVVGKVRATQVQLRWGAPPSDGGAKVISFTVQMAQTGDCEGKWHPASSGEKDDNEPALDFHDVVVLSSAPASGGGSAAAAAAATEHTVSDLSAGCWYSFRVRSSNSAGDGEWTEPLQVQTSPGVPEPAFITDASSNVPHQLHVEWQPPRRHNGAQSTQYRLFYCEAPQLADAADNSAQEQPTRPNFIEVYSGPNTNFDIRRLKPVTRYLLAVACSNSAGWSAMSDPVECSTMASTPGQINLLSVVGDDVADNTSPPLISATAVSLHWAEPETNGSAITSYKVDYFNMSMASGGSSEPSASPSHAAALKTMLIENAAVQRRQALLDRLQPDCLYRIRIRASNAVGEGPLSAPLQLRTLPLKPDAPKLQLLSATHNSARLKWTDLAASATSAAATSSSSLESAHRGGGGDGRQAAIVDEYVLEMTAPDKSDVFQVVYRGSLNAFKVCRLRSYTRYAFRVYAINVAGEGSCSSVLECRTEEEPPSPVRGVKATDIETTACIIHWDTFISSRHRHLYSSDADHSRNGSISNSVAAAGAGFAALHPELVVHSPVDANTLSVDAVGNGTTKNSSEAGSSDNDDDDRMSTSSHTTGAISSGNTLSIAAAGSGSKRHSTQPKPEQQLTFHVQLSNDGRHFETVHKCTSTSSYRLQNLSPSHTYYVRIVVKYIGLKSGKELTSPFSNVVQFSTFKFGTSASSSVSANQQQISDGSRLRQNATNSKNTRRESIASTTADVSTKQQAQKPVVVKKLNKSKKTTSWLSANPHVISLVVVLTLIVFFAIAAIFVSNPSINMNNMPNINRDQQSHPPPPPAHQQQQQQSVADQSPQTLPPPPSQVLTQQQQAPQSPPLLTQQPSILPSSTR